LLLFFMIADVARAQNKIQITGTLVDSTTHSPVGFATVSVKTAQNVPVKVMLSKEDGSFKFDLAQHIKYNLVINIMGYQTKTLPVDATGDKNISLGTIALIAASKQLTGVTIAADKPIIKQEIDRISYNLQADPDSKINSVLEMLRKVPFVTVDADDNILLKGNNSYRIFINGKPSSMMERDPKAILRSMPASTIQRIEVITVPPSKYDAEGLAGIINIITNKKVDNGYNASVNTSYRYPGGPGIGTSFTFKEDKLGVNGYGGGSIYSSPQTNSLNNRYTTGANPTNLVQQGNSSSSGRSGYFGTEISYELDSLNLISGQFNINGNKSNGKSYQASLLTNPDSIMQGYHLNNVNDAHGSGHDASVNYQLGFKANKNQLLTFSYNYYGYNNLNVANIATSNRIYYPTPDYNQNNNSDFTEHTIQADYVQPLKKVNMEAGVKTIFRDSRSNFEYNAYDATTGFFEPVPAFTNDFNYTQDIVAAYNTWQYAGKGWGFKVGARFEQTITNANFLSTATTVHQNYFNVVPSIAINKDLKGQSGLNFGFSQRLQRPGINRLNPFVDRSNPDFQTSGNPQLGPATINEFQLGYHISKKAQLNVSVNYDFANNIALQVSTFDPTSNITYTTYQNSGKASAIGTNINFNYPITQKWNFSLNGNVMHFWLNGYVNGVLQYKEFTTENMYLSTGYAFGNGWRTNATLNTNGRNPTGLQGSSNSVISTSFSVNKDVIKNKLSFSAAVNNPFTQYRNNIMETTGDGFSQTMLNQVYFRNFRVALNYSFGQLKGNIKKAKRGINNDDGAK